MVERFGLEKKNNFSIKEGNYRSKTAEFLVNIIKHSMNVNLIYIKD